MRKIYHYTHTQAACEIISSGFLKVSEFEKYNRVQKPALWLSLNRRWEPTASKIVVDLATWQPFHLSFKQQSESMGCIRFVLPFSPENLCNWSKYSQESGTSENMIVEMERVGRELGANPNHWYTSFSNIPLKEICDIQMWSGKRWVRWNGKCP